MLTTEKAGLQSPSASEDFFFFRKQNNLIEKEKRDE